MSKKRKKIIKYMDENINEIEISDKKIIAQMVISSDIRLYGEGTGVRFWFKDLEYSLLLSIYHATQHFRKKTQIL